MITDDNPQARSSRAHFYTGLTVLTVVYALTLLAVKHLLL